MNSFTRGQQTRAGSHLKHNWRWPQLLQDLFTLVERQELIYLCKSKTKGRYEPTAAVFLTTGDPKANNDRWYVEVVLSHGYQITKLI